MKVMHVIDSLQKGGAERMLVDIVNQTAEEGDPVSVTVTRDGTDLADELRPEVTLTVLGRKKRFDWRAMRKFATVVSQQRADILHVHGRSTFSFAALVKTIGLVRAPVLLHDHYGRIELDAAVPLWFKLWGRHCVGHYVGVSSSLSAWAQTAGVAKSKTAVIGNALNLNRILEAKGCDLRKAFSVPESSLVGLVIAGIRPEKGVELLLEAVTRCGSCPPFTIIVAGGDRDAEYGSACRRRRDSLGLKNKVVFAGERADVPDLIRGADFALITSLSESGPLVLIEFMAGGLPFVSTRVGEVATRVAELGVPELVPPNDTEAFTEALRRLLALSSAGWRDRAKQGREVALSHFDVRSAMGKWRAVYRRMVEGAKA